jgi:hypothetical protein
MDADLDLLLTTVFVTADDLLPERAGNARRRVTDAEVVTLCVAQSIMGIPSDRRFLKVAAKQLGHLFPELPKQPGFHKRRRRLVESIEWLMGVFASQSPGFHDDLLLIDSTPVECARSRETVKRSALGDAADYGYCASHSRYFWGFRCTRSSRLTAPPGRWRSHRPNATNERSASSCWPAANAAAARSCSATRAMPAKLSPSQSATSTRRSFAPAAKTKAAKAHTSPRSDSGSRASSGPAKTF